MTTLADAVKHLIAMKILRLKLHLRRQMKSFLRPKGGA